MAASIIRFFELNKYRVVDLDKEWISTIKEFKKILTRDKGSKGDIDGRKKLQATREFTFIYHYCDYASKFSNYSEDDKLKACQLNADLPDDFDYTKDEDIVAAVKKYKDLQETPALKMLAEAREGLHSAHKVIRKIRYYLEEELANLDFSNIVEEDEEDGKNKKKKVDPVTKLTVSLQNLMKLTNEVAPALKTIKELEEEVKLELGEKKGLRGDRQKGHREEAVERPTREVEDTSTGTAGIFDDIIG
jgi:hypothetical protein